MSYKNKLSHVVFECKYHIVLVPKYRYQVLTNDVKISLRDEIRKICTWKEVEILQGSVCKDHVHLFLSIPPKFAVADIMGVIKGKSAIRMFNKFPELRKRYWGSHFWARGYFASTVGINESIIKEYIRNQDKLDRLANQGRLFQ